MKYQKLAIIAVAIFAFSGSAFAAVTAPASARVTATVSASVSVSVTSADFGTSVLGARGTVGQASGTITVTASNGAAYDIAIDSGLNPNPYGAGIIRNMANANGDLVPYNLGKVHNSAPYWGDGVDNYAGTLSQTVAGTGNGLAQAVTYFAWGLQASPATGSYADVIQVTVAY